MSKARRDRRGCGRLAAAAGLLVAVAAFAPGARAADLTWRGSLMGDLRVGLEDDGTLERLEGTANVRLGARLSEHVAGVADVRLMFTEGGRPTDFEGLTKRSVLDPFRIESDALFVELIDLGLSGLDLRVGRQQIIWGSADRFHPVSNLNPLDLEDPLRFGEVIANEMVSLRYRPDFTLGDEDEPWLDEFSIELVWVPVFKPAELPGSAQRAFVEEDEYTARADTPLLKKLVKKQQDLKQVGWSFTNIPVVELPERTLKNSMAGARMSFRLLNMDLGFSYFRGFDDVPRNEKVLSEVIVTHADSDIVLTYPRVQVLGVDMATSLDWLGGAGLWAEVGVTLHDDLYRAVLTGPKVSVNEAEIEHEKGAFVKAVVGMDYSFTSWWYVNVQYLRGFPDEFGKRKIENYVVAGMDFKLGQDSFLIRLFNIANLDDGSFALFPQLTMTPWNGGELTLGALLYSRELRKDPDITRTFESKAVPPSTIFLQAKALF